MRLLRKYKLIIPSLLAMFITIVMTTVVTISFAWNSENRDVNSEGSSINIEIPIIVLVSPSYEAEEGITTINEDDLEDFGFTYDIEFDPTNVLYPATSYNGIDFRYATNVDTDGNAIDAVGGLAKFEPVEGAYARYFYLEKKLNFCTINSDDIILYLSNVIFGPGTTDSNLYKSIRVSFTYNNSTIVIRDSDGVALPANGDNTVVASDNSIVSSNINSNTFNIPLVGMQKDQSNNDICTPVEVIVRIWIEGQSPYAVVAYSGHAFKVNIDFDVKEN